MTTRPTNQWTRGETARLLKLACETRSCAKSVSPASSQPLACFMLCGGRAEAIVGNQAGEATFTLSGWSDARINNIKKRADRNEELGKQMKKTLVPIKKRPKSGDLVKNLITLLSLKIALDQEFTQEYAASLIGCHRHWFRNYKERYNIQTDEPDQRGMTPRDMLRVFEEERTKQVVNSPLEFAFINANAKVEELLQVIEALEDKVEAQRKSLHIISIYRYKLDAPEQKIFNQGLDEADRYVLL